MIATDSAATLNLQPSDVVQVSARFTGGINAFPYGAAICVTASGALAPTWINNASGAVLVRGTATFPSIATSAAFVLVNEGTTGFPQGMNTNGVASLRNEAGGTLTVGSYLNLSSGAVLENAGDATLPSNVNLNGSSRIENSGTMTLAGDLTISGDIDNTGWLDVSGRLTSNGQSTISNACMLTIGGDLGNNGALANSGHLSLGANLQNNGTIRSTTTGVMTGRDFSNDRAVTGFGQYRFTGSTRTQGTFVGDSPVNPIVFEDTSPGAGIFDTASGTVANVVRGAVDVTPPTAGLPGCRPPGDQPTADLSVTKSGPASIDEGGRLTYEITVRNLGPAVAQAVQVRDDLPPALSSPEASDAGTISGDVATWSLGDLAAGATRVLTVGGTAPSEGTLVDVARGSSTTIDPDDTNNNGSLPSASVTTVVQSIPDNTAPSVNDQTIVTVTDRPVTANVNGEDADAGQVLEFDDQSAPSHGSVLVQADGAYLYVPERGFAGRDRFTVEGCDNGVPVLCDSATVTIEVYPLVTGLTVVTLRNEPVAIPVSLTDRGTTSDPVVVEEPASGTVTGGQGGVFFYAPDQDFVGTDEFRYRTCSVTDPDLCGEATVTVHVVRPPNNPPVLTDIAVATDAESAIEGRVPVFEVDDGQTVTVTLLSPPALGTASVEADGAFRYEPAAGFSGRESFTVRGCDVGADGDESLCDDATVTVTVRPVAVDDAVAVVQDQTASVDVRSNDLGSPSEPVIVTDPDNGTAVANADGSVSYTPDAGYVGPDSLEYEVCSPSVPDLCSTAAVTITVEEAPTPNHPPSLADSARVTHVDQTVYGRLLATDPQTARTVTMPRSGRQALRVSGEGLTYRLVGPAPDGGVLVVNTNGTWTYTPDGSFVGRTSFRAEVTDDGGLTDEATVALTVRPRATDDLTRVRSTQAVSIDIGRNDLGDVGEPVLLGQPDAGTARLDGSVLTYVAGPTRTGIDSVRYRVCGRVATDICDDATVHIVVRPLTVDDRATTGAGEAVRVPVSANDAGRAGPPRTLVAPKHGQVTTVGYAMRYAPTLPFTGYDTYLYERCLRSAYVLCSPAAVTVAVHPLAGDAHATTPEGTPVRVSTAAGRVGRAGRPEIVNPASSGIARFEQDGTLSYAPLRGFVGTDVLTYRRCSTTAPELCGYAVVSIEVVPRQAERDLPDAGGSSGLLPLLGASMLAAGAALVLTGRRLRRPSPSAPAG
ncbi:tandem-95 repeat protein [Mumia zhuanghuii]|uniref:Ig-like domain-containing protein n=2 Tax=Mumia TaxID=1546255 RepID=A0ABW1QSJ4_9ACTN|nr:MULTISPECIES: Ig-like domain-containing protein [Mumia]KAA1418124.1 tandem-95 repeat protein [Mumia zhuanghuii]